MSDVTNHWEATLTLFLWSNCPLYLNIGGEADATRPAGVLHRA